MKLSSFITIAFFFASLTAWSYPTVGDKVQWQGSIHLMNGETTPVKISKEVTGYSSSSKKWTVKYVATVGKNVTTEFVEVDELYSPEKHKQMISNCTTEGGLLEKVQAPAGTYETCKIRTTTPEGLIVDKWWGDIPFGIVSRNTSDSGAENPDLNAIARGL